MRTTGAAPTCLLLAAAAALVGCGTGGHHEQVPGTAPSPAAAVVHRTAGGGEVATEATPVATPERLAAYVRPLSPDLRHAVRAAARRVSATAHGTVVAQVVAVGCDPVERATVVLRDDGVRIEPVAPATRHPECLAPVTSVALGVVPAYQ
jgi:hypothetical protein